MFISKKYNKIFINIFYFCKKSIKNCVPSKKWLEGEEEGCLEVGVEEE